jgi:hypothetical protein
MVEFLLPRLFIYQIIEMMSDEVIVPIYDIEGTMSVSNRFMTRLN